MRYYTVAELARGTHGKTVAKLLENGLSVAQAAFALDITGTRARELIVAGELDGIAVKDTNGVTLQTYLSPESVQAAVARRKGRRNKFVIPTFT